ncbi:MAG TPA: hypothetical protein VFV57_05960 [Limnobacter sp.]|nr:hypothetical protein [Limnobacter sp.]
MKIQTTIPPRKDGTVNFTGQDGKVYTFKDDGTGCLVCDVDGQADLKRMLLNPQFMPVDEEDFLDAERLAEQAEKELAKNDAAGLEPKDNGDDDDDDDEDDDGAQGGEPLEANTPPKRIKPKPKAK